MGALTVWAYTVSWYSYKNRFSVFLEKISFLKHNGWMYFMGHYRGMIEFIKKAHKKYRQWNNFVLSTDALHVIFRESHTFDILYWVAVMVTSATGKRRLQPKQLSIKNNLCFRCQIFSWPGSSLFLTNFFFYPRLVHNLQPSVLFPSIFSSQI